ncbi:im:7160594_1 [Blepharisma stoltei]|uniref:Lysosomal dipeptide transporter MFSD1 n=1 Tax=Blepharisma stoltei TaxID=1481888 RepID=A0AAU9JCS9_9CILI|nr:unnamed protein product [Blepharisma stoltei]
MANEDSESQQLTIEIQPKLVPIHDLTQTKWRYLFLFFDCTLCLGNYFAYDTPSVLQPEIMDRLHINSFEFNWFYSVYSFPNMILPFFGGFLSDTFGSRLAVFIFSLLVCFGQAIFALAITIESFPIAVLGRFIFGLGGENLCVVQGTILAEWFTGKELSMAYGMTISIGRLGSVINNILEPQFYSSTGSVVFGLWFGLFLCILSLILGLFLIFMDIHKDTLLGPSKKKSSEKIKISDIKSFNFGFWMLSGNCLVVYICVLTFNSIASLYFQTRFNFSSIEAGYFISITYIVAALFSPIFGILADRLGRHIYWIFSSALMMLIVHVIFILLPDCDKCIWGGLNLIILGMGYSIYGSTMWGSIPFLVDSYAAGTGFGIVTAAQNTGMTIGPIIVGAIHYKTEHQYGYTYVSLFFIIVAVIGVTTASMLWVWDRKNGQHLFTAKIYDSSRLESANEQEDLSKTLAIN